MAANFRFIRSQRGGDVLVVHVDEYIFVRINASITNSIVNARMRAVMTYYGIRRIGIRRNGKEPFIECKQLLAIHLKTPRW